MKQIILLGLLSLLPILSPAQQHDANLYKVIKAMENGKWGFGPVWYFWAVHQKYSGLHTEWQWRGLKSGFVDKFDENRSDTKRVFPVRVKAFGVDKVKLTPIQDYGDHMKNMFQDESKAAADRNLDLVYRNYAGDFEKKNRVVLELLEFVATESKGKLVKNITELSAELKRINEGIAYIHKTGVGYELENVKREKAYIAFNKQLDVLIKRAKHLALSADNLY